jgi:hypothetical protein
MINMKPSRKIVSLYLRKNTKCFFFVVLDSLSIGEKTEYSGDREKTKTVSGIIDLELQKYSWI